MTSFFFKSGFRQDLQTGNKNPPYFGKTAGIRAYITSDSTRKAFSRFILLFFSTILFKKAWRTSKIYDLRLRTKCIIGAAAEQTNQHDRFIPAGMRTSAAGVGLVISTRQLLPLLSTNN